MCVFFLVGEGVVTHLGKDSAGRAVYVLVRVHVHVQSSLVVEKVPCLQVGDTRANAKRVKASRLGIHWKDLVLDGHGYDGKSCLLRLYMRMCPSCSSFSLAITRGLTRIVRCVGIYLRHAVG